MGVELERLNAEHTMESRQDCQELVSICILHPHLHGIENVFISRSEVLHG